MNVKTNFPVLTESESAVYAECLKAQSTGREISDACARTIASFYLDGGTMASLMFFATGAITVAPGSLLRELFSYADYYAADDIRRLMMDMMGTYLVNRADRGKVAGWSRIWVTGTN